MSNMKRIIIPTGVLGLIIAVGFMVGAAVAGGGPDRPGPAPGVATAPGQEPAPVETARFPINANGQTYGASESVTFEDWPDLILVEASNGEAGYVERDLLNEVTGANVASPEEAVAWQKRSDAEGWTTKEIPVYKSDGKTEIGTFPIRRSTVTEPIKP